MCQFKSSIYFMFYVMAIKNRKIAYSVSRFLIRLEWIDNSHGHWKIRYLTPLNGKRKSTLTLFPDYWYRTEWMDNRYYY